MNKLWLILFMVSSILGFTACSDENDSPQTPLTDVVMNSMASIGDIFTINGSGFNKTSTQIYFRNENEEEIHVKDLEFTATGIQFKVPTELTPGKYTIILKQNGTWPLGEITLLAMSNPIKNLVYPTELHMGQNMTIQGEGFNSTAKVYLEDIDGKRSEALEIISTENGLTCHVPSNLKSQAFYTIVLTQDGGEWKSEIKAVALLIKRLNSIMRPVAGYWEYTAWSEEEPWGPTDSIWIAPKQNISELIYDTQGRLTKIIEYTEEEGEIVGEKATTTTFEYNTVNQIKVVVHNSIEYSSITFEVKNNQVETCTVLDVWDESYVYEWTYNEGYLTQITEAGTQEPIWEATYSDYNLKDIMTYGSNIPFEYGTQYAYGVNVPLLLTDDTFIKYAGFLGLTGRNSKNIPEKYYLTGSEEGIHIEGSTDNDGYLTNLSLSTENEARIFTYEVVQ